MKRFLYFTLLLLFPFLSLAQSPLSVHWEPELSYTWKASEKWSYNGKLTARSVLIREAAFGAELERVEVSLFATRSLFGGQKLSGGYLYRLAQPFFANDFGYEHRFMQQYAFISYISDRRLSHRVRTEQRLQRKKYLNRARYRLSYEIPLNGERLDPGETYLIASEEAIFAFNSREFEPENRLYLGIGWLFSNKRKLETGLQYRIEDIRTQLSHLLLLTTGFYFNR